MATLPAVAALATNDSAPRLFVKDGQFRSHPFTVFVTQDITPSMKPVLRLSGAHLFLPALTNADKGWEPKLVAPHQLRSFPVDGQQISFSGTLLLFDLTSYPIEKFKSAVRVTPVLEWTETRASEDTCRSVAPTEVYLGNMAGAGWWTIAFVGTVTSVVLMWAVQKSKQEKKFKGWRPFFLITGPDGYLSLWRAQLLLWTAAVGSMVFLFGVLRLDVPDIPETLVVLMGLSLVTGGLSAHKSTRDTYRAQEANEEIAPYNSGPPRLSDLVSSYNVTRKQVELSVAKAQMVFWTAMVLVLFVVKSLLDGALWSVPWQLVALTGISQAGYISDKYLREQLASKKPLSREVSEDSP